MTEGVDGRHRDKDGRIERKRIDTKIGTLKPSYPALSSFPDKATLGTVLQGQGADSLSDLLRKLRGN
jgi:hypothetical protein